MATVSEATPEAATCDGLTAAKVLGVSYTTLRKYVRLGYITPVCNPGCDPRYNVEQLRAFGRGRSEAAN